MANNPGGPKNEENSSLFHRHQLNEQPNACLSRSSLFGGPSLRRTNLRQAFHRRRQHFPSRIVVSIVTREHNCCLMMAKPGMLDLNIPYSTSSETAAVIAGVVSPSIVYRQQQAQLAIERFNNVSQKNRSRSMVQFPSIGWTSSDAVPGITTADTDISQLRSKLRDSWAKRGSSGFLLAAWAISCLLVIVAPLCKWSAERNSYYAYYGQYRMYQQQQQQYEQQQRQYEQQQNGNYNNNYWAGSYYNSCSWYDFKCKYNAKKYQAMYQNQNGQQQGGGQQGDNNNNMVRAVIPGWYYLFGGQIEMEDDRQRQEMGMTSESEEGGMKFVYACSIILFTVLTIFGFYSMYTGKERMGLIFALVTFGIFTLMNLLTTVQGTIETDNRFFEDSIYGWFGQWAVLTAYTDFWMICHCFFFAILLGVLKVLDMRAKRDVEKEELDSYDHYQEDMKIEQNSSPDRIEDGYVHAEIN